MRFIDNEKHAGREFVSFLPKINATRTRNQGWIDFKLIILIKTDLKKKQKIVRLWFNLGKTRGTLPRSDADD